jgi:hypothetical protein
VVAVGGFDGRGQCLPHLGVDVALDVAADDPHDVGAVFVSSAQEGAVVAGLRGVDETFLHQRAPDGHHTYIYAVLRGGAHDVVEVVPI